jgi:hypothetical protein
MTQIRQIITDLISANHNNQPARMNEFIRSGGRYQRSMKIVLISISVFLLSNFQSENKRLNFSVKNSTNQVLSDIKVGLPGAIISYPLLAPNSQTKWVKVKSAYSHGDIKFTDNKKREYILKPKDYAGEKLISSGNLTYVIKSVDTLSRKIELDHILQQK